MGQDRPICDVRVVYALPPIATKPLRRTNSRFVPKATFRAAEKRSTNVDQSIDAQRIAADIAKLPKVPSHILKGVPMRRHSASQDD
jgi:hypothetical protein